MLQAPRNLSKIRKAARDAPPRQQYRVAAMIGHRLAIQPEDCRFRTQSEVRPG